MSNIQLKFIRHAIKQENMSLNQEKKIIEGFSKMTEMMELADKYFKTGMMNTEVF